MNEIMKDTLFDRLPYLNLILIKTEQKTHHDKLNALMYQYHLTLPQTLFNALANINLMGWRKLSPRIFNFICFNNFLVNLLVDQDIVIDSQGTIAKCL